LRKKIPIPHLNPPPSQREGGGLGEEPLSILPLRKEDPFHILPLRKRERLPPPNPPPPSGRGRIKVGEGFPAPPYALR